MWSWQTMIVLVALSGCLMFAPGCASEQHFAGDDEIVGIERPAVPIDDEESLGDKIGEVGVVLLVVGGVLAGIALPFLLF